MTRTNFQYEKRQRELEKKRKAEEKARRRLEAKQHKGQTAEGEPEMHGASEEEGQRVHDPA